MKAKEAQQKIKSIMSGLQLESQLVCYLPTAPTTG